MGIQSVHRRSHRGIPRQKSVLLLLLCAILFSSSWSIAQQDGVLQLKEEIIGLQNRSPLGFRALVGCTRVLGYGSYEPLLENKVKTGSVLMIYFEPQNFFTKKAEGKYEIWLTQDLVILSEKQQEIFKKENTVEIHQQTISPHLDLHGTNQLSLVQLPAGKYVYKAILHDKLKGETAEATWAFEVVQ